MVKNFYIAEKMATSREVYSEDDNFIIGDDFITDRFRREARQLHLSAFPRIRREAHFTRYRNSFLKCGLDQTHDQIEQGRKLRLAETERARAAVLKQEENRRKHRCDILLCYPTNGKLVRKDGTGERTGSESRVVKGVGEQDSSLGVASSSSSRASPVSGSRGSAEKQELTTATIPRLIISPRSTSDDERCSFESNQNSRKDLPLKGGAHCGENDSPTVGRKQLNKRLSVGASRFSRTPYASYASGKHDLAGNHDRRLSAAASRLSLAPLAAENRDFVDKPVETTLKIPSLHVTSLKSDRKDSFGSSIVVVEKAGRGENPIEGRAKSSRNSSVIRNRAQKEVETDPDNRQGDGIKELNKRTHSASVSESDSESSLSWRSCMVSRVSRKSVSPTLTESQESHKNKAQTQSAHERWMWEEFDKIMQGFADLLQIEYKSVNFKNKRKAVEKDMKQIKPPLQNVAPNYSLNNPMTPLYFRFGISDRIVFRC